MLRTWAADAHDARLLGLQCWLAHALASNENADRPGRLMLMMLAYLACNAGSLTPWLQMKMLTGLGG